MKGPKLTVIGAGSYFFGKTAIWKMIKSETLRNGTLALVDTNPEVLGTMMQLAKRAIEASGAPTKLIGSIDYREVIGNSDFIVLTFSERNTYYRGVDTRITAKYGITMCSSDTIGPGGIFRALREIPQALKIARDMEELCPDAWLINFVNPTSVLGIALMRYAKVKSFALCDGNHEPGSRLFHFKNAGILTQDTTEIPADVEAEVDLRIAGVNHCTWITKFTYEGKDVLPAYRDHLAQMAEQEFIDGPNFKAKPRLNSNYALQLFDIYGAVPTAISHTKEYVPFFQGLGVMPNEPGPLISFDANLRAKEMADAWKETEKFANGETPIETFLDGCYVDHASDIIESMWGSLGKPFFVNSANHGAVTNMPDDAFLELRCDLDMNGPRTQSFGEMPRGLLGLQMQVLDTHELTAEAAVTYEKKTLLKALITDPLVNNIGDAKMIMEELLAAEKDTLPAQWYR